MSYRIEISFPLHRNVTLDPQYDPRSYTKDSPEDAAVAVQEEIAPVSLDLSRAVERLHGGKLLVHEDKETGRKVIAYDAGAEIGERCVRCEGPFQGTAGWGRTTAGLLCPDCTVAVCPDERVEISVPAGVTNA